MSISFVDVILYFMNEALISFNYKQKSRFHAPANAYKRQIISPNTLSQANMNCVI